MYAHLAVWGRRQMPKESCSRNELTSNIVGLCAWYDLRPFPCFQGHAVGLWPRLDDRYGRHCWAYRNTCSVSKCCIYTVKSFGISDSNRRPCPEIALTCSNMFETNLSDIEMLISMRLRLYAIYWHVDGRNIIEYPVLWAVKWTMMGNSTIYAISWVHGRPNLNSRQYYFPAPYITKSKVFQRLGHATLPCAPICQLGIRNSKGGGSDG